MLGLFFIPKISDR